MTSVNRNGLFKVVMALVLVVALFMSFSVMAFAGDEEEAEQALYDGIQNAIGDKDYKLEGGGTIKGKDVIGSDGKVNNGNFERLSTNAQQELINDIDEASQDMINDDASDVSQATVQDWYRQLQETPGAGTRFLNLILQNTKPDFVTANKIYEPFSGVVGVVMGVIAVFVMGLLGIVMVSDIAYIALPPLQALSPCDGAGAGTANDGKRSTGSFFFSEDAKYAVRLANTGEDGTRKQALGIYLKRRVPMLILLGICLMYLISGSIYKLVGFILDLVSGFLGF